ncbi:GAF domain-containing protein [Mycobacterium simiae]|uniref:GAF domain-containing protein n=1 Tax=Mycobacterium simiae TaxID=1784 RepID=UPI0027B9543E|nr:GAF domain-containing protein [Mycobacterium simiae]
MRGETAYGAVRVLGGEKMRPRFGPRVGRLGVHSALSLSLSLPLLVSGRVIGAIDVYAHGKDVFDEHAAELGQLFAQPAAVAVHNAQILAQAMALMALMAVMALTAQLQTDGR